MSSGFLVVLKPKLSPSSGKLYAGVYRVPYYPTEIPGEEAAMDEYVFGDFKDLDTNLIPSLQAAIRLCRELSLGGRQFEIIYCRDPMLPLPSCLIKNASIDHLGYDVAGIDGDYWSIVYDFSKNNWSLSHKSKLNKNGLFYNKHDAQMYLDAYIKNCDYYWDSNQCVIEIIRINVV